MSDYRDYQVESSPSWLRGAVAEAWSYALGLVKDGFAEAARQAVKVRLVGLAPSDALEPLLRDRNLDVPAVSSDSILRTRIRRAWATWSIAGTKESILTSLADAGYPNASVREGTEWSLPHWWWFYMVLRPPYPWSVLGATDADKALVCGLITKWKPAHAHLVNIIVLSDGLLWGDRPVWGACPPWGGTIADYWTC